MTITYLFFILRLLKGDVKEGTEPLNLDSFWGCLYIELQLKSFFQQGDTS